MKCGGKFPIISELNMSSKDTIELVTLNVEEQHSYLNRPRGV